MIFGSFSHVYCDFSPLKNKKICTFDRHHRKARQKCFKNHYNFSHLRRFFTLITLIMLRIFRFIDHLTSLKKDEPKHCSQNKY